MYEAENKERLEADAKHKTDLSQINLENSNKLKEQYVKKVFFANDNWVFHWCN